MFAPAQEIGVWAKAGSLTAGRLGRPWEGVKTCRCVWDDESDQLPSPHVHKGPSGLSRHSGRDGVRGFGDELCAVQAHWFEFFDSPFAPGFAPDSRSTSIPLHHIHSGRIAHRFNANLVHRLTHHTLSLSPLVALFRRGAFDERDCLRNTQIRARRLRSDTASR
jgi:hypothetical protein